MPSFISGLIALVITFAQHGKPETSPPFPQQEVVLRGNEISDLAKSLHGSSTNTTSNTTNTSSDENGQTNFGQDVSSHTPDDPRNDGRTFGLWVSKEARNETANETENETANETGEAEEGNHTANTTRVSVDNIRSGFHLPALVPQVAVDHAQSLQLPTGTPFPLPPGKINKI